MRIAFLILSAILVTSAGSFATAFADYLVASYEPSEVPPLAVTSSEVAIAMVQGGVSGVPPATDGSRVLKVTWTNQPDGKVEMRHSGLSFDLAGYNYLLIDFYMTTDLFAGSSNPQIGIWDANWTGNWYPVITIPQTPNKWYTLVIDISGNNQTGLTSIYAFLFDHMTVSSGTVYIDNIRLAQQLPPLPRYPEDPNIVEHGLRYEYFEGSWEKLPDFYVLTPEKKGLVDNFDISVSSSSDNFALCFSGYIDVPVEGNYTFYTNSDDGSELYIGNMLVVNNDGLHPMTEQAGSIYLAAGKHAITVNFFDKTGSQNLIVSYEGPCISKTAIPDNVLYRKYLNGDFNLDWQVDLYDLAIFANNWLNTYDMSGLGQIANNWLDGKFGLQIRNGWLYIDNEKFFVKGIGYEAGARPGQYPWERTFEPGIITLDMNRIIDGGFNTIRTWSDLTEEELALIDSMGLKIIFGIYVNPHGDFGDPAFIIDAENNVRKTLNYSKNYSSIIGYLIMNEPTTEDVYNAGAAETVSLWTRLKNIINQEHPGVPVSFANTGAGDFVNMNIFNLSGYNLYMYGPSPVKHSMGYTGFVDYLKDRSPKNPLVITEFGLSVSPDGPGGYGYGGNSLQEQSDGDLYMYRSLIDGGAQGGCIFNYLDGWWKNNDIPNDADTHEPEPEEWFGLWGIENETSDPNSTARQAWYAMKEYNMCIITSPKNGEIYDGNVPLEFFPDSRVDTIRIKKDSTVLYEKQSNGNKCIEDTLVLSMVQPITDVNLYFEFLDANNTVLKTENIVCLCSQTQPVLPTLDLTATLANLNDSSVCPIQITVQNNTSFTIKNNEVKYVFYPHIGWDPGVERTRTLSFSGGIASFSDSYSVSSQSKVLSISAGITIQYGQFEKRLYDVEIIQRGDWANPICHRDMRY
jgi:hypothetical protein